MQEKTMHFLGSLAGTTAVEGIVLTGIQFKQCLALLPDLAKRVDGRVALDFGCGTRRPVSISTLLHLFGAQRVHAFDPERAADHTDLTAAPAAILLAADLAPEVLGLSGDRRARQHRAQQRALWDIQALLQGDHQGMAEAVSLALGTQEDLPSDVAFVFSQSVFEHISHPSKDLARLYAALASDGVIYTAIDYRDHRVYTSGLSIWQYLFDGGDVYSGYINKIRHSAMVKLIQNSGFFIDQEILICAEPSTSEWEAISRRGTMESPTDIRIVEARLVLSKGKI